MGLLIANVAELWSSAWPAGVIMLALGSAFALVLLIASIKLKVEVDPDVEQIQHALPSVDCGACGFAGCSQYAKAVKADPELIGKCAPGGEAVANEIARILNLEISSEGPPHRPIVHCRAHTQDKTFYAEYTGIESCCAADAQPIVQACKFGCLGYGDCMSACKFDAIHVVDGLAVVDYDKCTGCGACVKACPRDLIEMVPFTNENMITVACSNREAGRDTRKMCKVGCIACTLCTKQSDVFSMADNLARTDYGKYSPDEGCGTAYEKCPTGVIVYRGKGAPDPRKAGEKASAKA